MRKYRTDALDVSMSYFLYESPDKIPLTECIQDVLNGKNEKQQEYLIHMLEEMAKGLDKLMQSCDHCNRMCSIVCLR